MKKVAINVCYGGFGLSDAVYEKLIEWGIPVRKYTEQIREEGGQFKDEPSNDGEVIFDRELTPIGESTWNDRYHEHKGNPSRLFGQRYWETWISYDNACRAHPLIIRAIEELGEAANGEFAELKIVEIPDDVEFIIDEYDGLEHIAEKHRTWN